MWSWAQFGEEISLRDWSPPSPCVRACWVCSYSSAKDFFRLCAEYLKEEREKQWVHWLLIPAFNFLTLLTFSFQGQVARYTTKCLHLSRSPSRAPWWWSLSRAEGTEVPGSHFLIHPPLVENLCWHLLVGHGAFITLLAKAIKEASL